MKTAMQLKALIRNLSKEKGLPPEVILRNYMLERFLERVSLSKYKHQISWPVFANAYQRTADRRGSYNLLVKYYGT